MKYLIVSTVCLGLFLLVSTVCVAMPVHYAAVGSIMDKEQQQLTISGWVNFDDQLRDWHGEGAGVPPVSSLDYLGQNQFYIIDYSLKVGSHFFSGMSGHLYMEFIMDQTLNDWTFGDSMWFLEDGLGPWDEWGGELFHFYNPDGTEQNHTSQYFNLANKIQLVSFDYNFNDPILPTYSSDFNLWLTRQDPTPVPEPSTLAFVAASLLGLFAFRRVRS